MKTKFLSIFTLLFLLTIISSCNREEKLEDVESIVIVDNALVTALTDLGFEFDAGVLKQTKKVKQTKSLDLSVKKISNLEGIKAFEGLEDINLADNDFDLEFDFAQLPQSVSSIDLRDNDLYEFYNISTDRTIRKLYLPEQARFNMEDVLDFYKANKEAVDKGRIDMKMTNKGELKPYNSLREIPDSNLKIYLQDKFPSLFVNSGDLLDIATAMRIPENTEELHVQEKRDGKHKKMIVENFEGVQYIIHHKDYGASWAELTYKSKEKNNTIEYLKVPKNGLTKIWLTNFHIPKGVNITSEALNGVVFNNVSGFKMLDLSTSSNFFVGGILNMAMISLLNCSDLEEIIVPKSNLSELQFGKISFNKLPNLKKADLSHLDGFFNGGAFCDIPKWNPQYPQKLVNVDDLVGVQFSEESLMTTHRDKTIEFMHKVAAAATKYIFLCKIVDENNKVKYIRMDKDGNFIDSKGNFIDRKGNIIQK